MVAGYGHFPLGILNLLEFRLSPSRKSGENRGTQQSCKILACRPKHIVLLCMHFWLLKFLKMHIFVQNAVLKTKYVFI